YVVSAAGIDFSTNLHLGRLKLLFDSGSLIVEFRLFASASEWLRQRVWGWLLGWFIRLVEIIISGWVTIVANAMNMAVLWTIPNEHIVDLDDSTAEIMGNIRQLPNSQPAANDDELREGVGIGIRRLVTSSPGVQYSFGYEWTFDACSDAWEAFGDGRLIDALIDLFGGCLPEQTENVIRYVTAPIIYLFVELGDWLFELTEEINKAINNPLIEAADNIQDDNDFAALLRGSVENFYFRSNIFGEIDADVCINRLPFPLRHAAILAGGDDDATTCAIVELSLGGRLQPHGLVFDVERIGAKTHYRSYRDFADSFTSGGRFDFNYPPVRFCVAGDNPPGSSSISTTDIISNTTFDEIRTDDAWNWNHQCAYFIDTHPSVCIATPPDPSRGAAATFPLEMFSAVSNQTVFLINEIFFCPDNTWCNVQGDHIRRRAQTALCSLLADIWYRMATPGTSIETVAPANLLDALRSENIIVRAVINEAFLRAGVDVTLQNALSEYAGQCPALLAEAGAVTPSSPQHNPCTVPVEGEAP
ncbi:MAG: hypothetical protein HY465_03355, partial [Deltaproteobacteria bacterium]|nr:hypothetical protein [Deltaproteobacteria bacterium]